MHAIPVTKIIKYLMEVKLFRVSYVCKLSP